MKDPKKSFKNIERAIRQFSWFTEGWDIYNRGAYIQLYKENWYNQNQAEFILKPILKLHK